PGGHDPLAGLPPQVLRVEETAQQAKLVSQTPPVYPAEARQIRLSGVVRLRGLIAKDGIVKDIAVASGHPLLVPPAIEAVRKWVYQPALVDGQPVEVAATVNVNFSLSGQ